MSDPQPRRWQEPLLHTLALVAIAIVLWPVLQHPTEVLYSERSDIFPGHHPYRHLQAEAWREGRWPQLWNPTAFAGISLIADPQSGIFYPPNWLQLVLPSQLIPAAYGWLLLAHLALGAFGMLYWLRGQGLAAGPRLVGALSFVLSCKWLLHIVFKGHLVFAPLVWVPWQLACIDRLARGGGRRTVAGLALVTALAILGMHSQLLFFSQLLVAGYALLALSGARRARISAAVRVLAGAALGVSLCSVMLLPVLAGLSRFVRGEGLSYEQTASMPLRASQAIELLLPGHVWGTPEKAAFFGVLAVALALFAPLAQRAQRGRNARWTTWYFLAGLLLMVWYALGSAGGLHRFLHDSVYGFSMFRAPSRVLLLAGLPLAYLSAQGAAVLFASRGRRSCVALAVLLALGGALLVALRPGVESAIAAALLLAPLLCALSRTTRLASVAATALALLVTVDATRVVTPRVRTAPWDEALGDNPLTRELRAPLGTARVLAFDQRSKVDISSLPITYCTPHGIECVGGFNPLVPELLHRFLSAAVTQRPSIGSRTTIPVSGIESRRHLDLLNVRWLVVNGPPLEIPDVRLRREHNGLLVYHVQVRTPFTLRHKTSVYENTQVLPRAMLVRSARWVDGISGAMSEIDELRPRLEVLVEDPSLEGSYAGGFQPIGGVLHRGDEIRAWVDAGEGGYLVLSELWDTGWRALVDDEPARLERANGVFMLLQLDAGRHEVLLRYRPPAYERGLRVSLGALVVWLGLLVPWPRLDFVYKKKTTTGEDT